MPAVELIQLTKVFPGGVTACADVSLAVEAGERLVLLGPSGCGKTTLLRLVAGLEAPTAGRVRLGGADAAGLPPHRRGVALLAQRPVLYPHLRVRDNLRFGLPRSAASERRVAEAVELLRLGDLLERRPGQLSGGQQQRAALARAIARQPAVLLLDEPLGNIDGPQRWELRQELDLLCRRLAVTMICVTHEQEEALSLADRLAVLDRGRLLQHGPPIEVHDRPASVTVARLLGWPPINLLPGRVGPDGFETEGFLLPLPAACAEWRRYTGQSVFAGIRPQQVRAGDDPATSPQAGGLPMTVAKVDPLGDGWAVFLVRGQLALVGRWARRPTAAAAVEVGIDLATAHLFDAATGLALLHPHGTQAG